MSLVSSRIDKPRQVEAVTKIQEEGLEEHDYRDVLCCIAKKYHLGQKIGGGGFGQVYLGTNLRTRKGVAIKIEPTDPNGYTPWVHLEADYYRRMVGTAGIPSVEWYGSEGPDHQIMVLELLGPSLQDLFENCNYQFSLKTVLQLAHQLIGRLQNIHNHSLVHQDLKPRNIMMGLNEKRSTAYIGDFGLAKEYRNSFTLKHYPFKDKRKLTGTAKYSSLNAHRGFEQSRRDDMESLGYVLINFLKGGLPWSYESADQKANERIFQMKRDLPVEELCRDLPEEFAIYINYCRKLQFEARPNYTYLQGLFQSVFKRRDFKEDGLFDWDVKFGQFWPPLWQHSEDEEITHSQTCNARDIEKRGNDWEEKKIFNPLESCDQVWNKNIQEEEIERLKEEVRNCVAAYTEGVPTAELQEEYQRRTGRCIPLFQYGFVSLFHFIRQIEGIKVSKNSYGKMVLMAENDLTLKADQMDEKEEMKAAIKRCIESQKMGLPIKKVIEVYKAQTGQNDIPLTKHGYMSIHHVLNDIPEVTSFKNQAGDTILKVKKNDNEDIDEKEQSKPIFVVHPQNSKRDQSCSSNWDNDEIQMRKPEGSRNLGYAEKDHGSDLFPYQPTIESVKDQLKRLLTLNPDGIPTYQLNEYFRNTYGKFIPYCQLGFASLFHFLREIPEIKNSRNKRGELVYVLKTNEFNKYDNKSLLTKSNNKRSNFR